MSVPGIESDQDPPGLSGFRGGSPVEGAGSRTDRTSETWETFALTASKRITAAADAVGAALATAEFRERLSAAAPAEGREVKALALAELVRCGVDLTGVALALSWDPSRPAL